MPKELVLIVDDEEDILELVRFNLSKEGYRVKGVTTGEEAMKAVEEDHYDLVILDLMLPGMDGLDVCRELRAKEPTRQLPIIILSAKGEEADVVAGLELGADDYVQKPFSPRVLSARVKAVLRRRKRPAAGADEVLNFEGLYIHPGRREVHVDGTPVELTSTEFDLLVTLARKPGWVFTRYQIVDAVHGDDYPVTDRSVDVQMVGLRRKLGARAHYVETVRGVGYRFRE